MCFGSGGGNSGPRTAPSDGPKTANMGDPAARPPGMGGSVGSTAMKTGLLSNTSATDPAKPKTLLGG